MRVRQARRHLRRQHARLPRRHGRADGLLRPRAGPLDRGRQRPRDQARRRGRRPRPDRHDRRRRAPTASPRSASTTPSCVKLAQLYDPGKSLWRSTITHFTPWDYNWPYGLPDGADGPDGDGPDDGDPDGDDPCNESGSIILCESAGARRAVADHRHAVHARLPVRPRARPRLGRLARRPADQADVAGLDQARRHDRRGRGPHDQAVLRAARSARRRFVWNGRDAYGRVLQGRQKVDVTIDYVYDAVYRTPDTFRTSFAAVGGARLTANSTRTRDLGRAQVDERRRRRPAAARVGARGLERRRPPRLRPDRPHALPGRRHQAQRRGPELRHDRDRRDRAGRARGHGRDRGRRPADRRLRRARDPPRHAAAPRP